MLSEIVQLKTGPFGSALHQSDYLLGGIPLITPTHIQEGMLTPDSRVAIGIEKAEALKDFALKKDDIVMGRRGEMGRCAVIR